MSQRVATAFNFVASGITGPASLSFPVDTAPWLFDGMLSMVGTATGPSSGIRLSVLAPSGARFEFSFDGMGGSAAVEYASRLGTASGGQGSASGAMTPQLYLGASNAQGPVWVSGAVFGATGGVSGTLQILVSTVPSGATGTVRAGSYMKAWQTT